MRKKRGRGEKGEVFEVAAYERGKLISRRS